MILNRHAYLRDIADITARCENCNWERGRLDVAHCYSKGAGQVDALWNTCFLCRTCHSSSHSGNTPTRDDMLAIAAKREGVAVASITAAVYWIRNLDRSASCRRIRSELLTLATEPMRMVRESLIAAGKLPQRSKA